MLTSLNINLQQANAQIPVTPVVQTYEVQQKEETPVLEKEVLKPKFTAIQIANAIKTQESGGSYTARGVLGEYGAYQYRPGTWNTLSKQYLGYIASMTKTNQDTVTFARIDDLLKQGYTTYQIALIWNGGEPKVKKGITKSGVRYDSGAYARKILALLPS